jgi:phosphohistidine phosphatase SixA
MKYFLTTLLVGTLLTSFSQTYFVVRHAEKQASESSGTTMSSNSPLSEAGKQRAEALKDMLRSEKIGYIFSTNTVRTLSTAEPTKNYFNLQTKIYEAEPDDTFIAQLLSLRENTLIVGHSNTVDDIVNKLCGSVKIPANLLDSAYDDLFVVTKKGKTITFEARKYGNPSQ